MSKLIMFNLMALDGFFAGPNQGLEHPLGMGGDRLHEWVLPLAERRAPHGLDGGAVNESSAVVRESNANIGATITGRNMFGGYPGPWDAGNPWNGWRGENPPFHHPVFVLTHYAREPLALEGGTTFTFVTEGIEAALAQARQAAGGMDVALAGGAKAFQQYFAARLVDEMGAQPRANSPRRRGAVVRGPRRRPARARTGADRCHAQGGPSQVRKTPIAQKGQ